MSPLDDIFLTVGYTTFAVNHDVTDTTSGGGKKKKGKDRYDVPNLIRPRPEFLEKLKHVSTEIDTRAGH